MTENFRENLLMGQNIVVYDVEIKNVIDGIKIGWKDHAKMGISTAVLFDYRDGDYKVYMDENIQELGHRLNTADLVVAFNQIHFDNTLLRACGVDLKSDSELKNYDMLVEGRKGMGWNATKLFPKGCKLDDFLLGTFGKNFVKTDHGSNAPILWQAGKVAELITYNIADVRREKMLFEAIVSGKEIRTATHGVHKFTVPNV